MNKEMQRALELDGEKLRHLTGEDHGPHFISDLPVPCPECGGDGGFEEAGSGKWSECTFCAGSGEVESEAAGGLRDLEERAPFRHFTEAETAAWEKVFDGVFCPVCGVHLTTSDTTRCGHNPCGVRS